jgi:hypothetical protein
MQGVLKVMSVLEKYPITKENLEVGHYVDTMKSVIYLLVVT